MYRFTLVFIIAMIFMKASIARQPVEKILAEKILLVTIDEIGIIKVGRDTVGSAELIRYTRERLFKSYLGTGQMHNRIKLQKLNPIVPGIVSAAVEKEIKDAQKNASTEICVQKYNRKFDDLEKRRQDKIKKKFSVLFQTDYL
ncbi:MAG: hypothetical protein LH619_06485 [Chitinophagaceae bacterium]|nr:hypothetical protein [Chitinophagaceae bacterium]